MGLITISSDGVKNLNYEHAYQPRPSLPAASLPFFNSAYGLALSLLYMPRKYNSAQPATSQSFLFPTYTLTPAQPT